MRYLFTIFLACLFSFVYSQQETYSRVKVFANETQLTALAAEGIDVTEGNLKKGTFLICDYSETEIAKIQGLGLQYEILIEDVSKDFVERNIGKSTNVDDYKGTSEWMVPENFEFGSMTGHATYQEVVDHLDNMFDLFPNLITEKVSIGQSIEGRDLWMVKISDNPGTSETEPQVLYTALHHAREPAGLMTLVYYMYYLLENYDNDPFIETLVNNTEMYFVPVINPDGYVYNQTTNPNGGGMWRKNRRDNSGTSCTGVDINRNYGYMWGLDNVGSSPDPCDETYRGESAFSEPETQAIRDFCEDHEFVNALNYHTHGNLLLYAWGYTEDLCEDDALYFAHSTIYTADNNYTYGAGSTTIYPTNGGSDDWMYGEQTTKPKILAYTPELGGGNDGFWCDLDRIIPIAQENMIMNILVAAFAGNYYDVQETAPTIFDEVNGDITFDITRLGLQEGNVTISLNAIGNNIASVGEPLIVENLDLLESETGTIPFTLVPGILSGHEFKFQIAIDNGDYITYDTLSKIFGTALPLFEDNCNTLENWVSPVWDVTTSTFVSPPGSITDSPFGDYQNNQMNAIILTEEVDLSNYGYAQLTFNAKWEIEQGWDYVQLMISDNGGINWTALEGNYTVTGNSNQAQGEPLYDGFQTTWVQEEIDLTDYIGSIVKFRFILKSDSYVTEDGFYFDDFTVLGVEMAYTGVENPSSYIQALSDAVPNPASGSINIYMNHPMSDARIDVYNLSGQHVYQLQLYGTESKVTIPVADWTSGIYFYQLDSAGAKSEMKKFIVL
ncbi:MAG: immune inhibitor A [Bacteroidales bacterium]|nr:immune inhibitor A [Bacteroidales bacterium]MCF8402705.1 immune inhibitor A [Bacteroidales bacterium]